MGHIGNTARISAFRGSLYNRGLHENLCDIKKKLGHWKAADTAVIRRGQVVMQLPSTGEIDVSDGDNVLGFSSADKISLSKALIVDEAIVFTVSGGTVTVTKPQTIEGVSIRSAIGMGGTQYTGGGTDYSFASNGVITHSGGGSAIPVGTTVYITYTYAMTANDHMRDGTNFFNSQDEVTLQEGRIAVITDWAMLYSCEYVTGVQYTLTGTGANLYVTKSNHAQGAGKVSNEVPGGGTTSKFIGRVIQLPTASEPFLGFISSSSPILV